MSRKLVELLMKERLITQNQLQDAEGVLKSGGDPIRQFIEKKALSESKLVYFLSQKFSMQSINLAKFEVKPDVISIVSIDLAQKTQAIPIQMNRGIMVVAIPDPTQLHRLEDIKFATKLNVEAVLTTFTAFDAAMMRYYGGTQGMSKAVEQFKKDAKESKSDEVQQIDQHQVHEVAAGGSTDDAPVISVVNSILTEAIRRGASDIHVEPYEKDFRVRLRIDGTLVDITHIPTEMKRAVISRFKIMSRMDIAESRIPQDGRIKIKIGSREVDFRVNTLPTLFGEKVVLRILSKGNLQLDLKKLGFEEKQLELFRKGISQPNGMVLVTGPTGSGKTTTLYSALMELNQVSDNLSTVEDPVEYNLEGINQVQVQKEVGLSFASVLRALLRQDPDTVLVGEIRDYETAEVAVQAALTGHLVLSTLHTNDTVATITRLINMGLEPFLVTASVNTILAQRLLRTLCSHCKTPATVPEKQLEDLGILASSNEARFHTAPGCSECNNTGYKGRVAIYEVLEYNQQLKEMTLEGRSAIEIKRAAVQEYNLQTLRMSALRKAMEGRTSIEEAISMTTDH
ncbi:MAG: type IV-A pilus assembly ATPase PilB [Bdellovibrionales bacterium]|nr:type IV-A pilus assembly ATPase PilB [Bdellovibrionales bacterium]